MEDRSRMMEEMPVSRLIWKLTLPSVAGVMAYNLYNLFDTVFVSRGAGTDAVGGVAVSFPLFLFLSAISSTLGNGAASLISRALGAGDRERAARTAANTFLIFYTVAILITVLGLLFLEPLLYAAGVTDTLLPYARSYMRIILLGAVTSTGFSSLIRAEGDSRYAMLIWIIPMSVNTVLDVIFVFGMHMGVTGAALGTVLGQAVSMGMSIWFFFLSGKSTLTFQRQDFRPDWKLAGEILFTGIPAFLQTSGYSVSIIIVNQFLKYFGGDTAISIYGIISRIQTFFLFPVMGLIQGIQPAAGYNKGAGKTKRTQETLWKGMKIAGFYGVAAWCFLLAAAPLIMRIFTKDQEVMVSGASVLRITGASLFFGSIQQVQSAWVQALGKKKRHCVWCCWDSWAVSFPSYL